jgi:single-strand DNA-binding protein
MPTLNQVSFIGRLGKDPVSDVTSNGKQYTKFTLAIDQGKNAETMWLNITCWDKLAETVKKYARTGMLVFVQGKLQMRKYKDKNKANQISIEVIATIVQLLEKRQKDEEDLSDALNDEAQ